MRRIIKTSLAILLIISIAILGACGGASVPPPPPVSSYEVPPIEEALAVGESFESGGIKFTLTEYIVLPKIRDYPPLESGVDYLLMNYKAENLTGETLPPPYSDMTMLLIYQDRALTIPSLIFTPDVPLPDGRRALYYPYRSIFSGELEGGRTGEGWQAYLVPIGFNPAETYLRVMFEPTGYVFWNLDK